MMCSDPYVQPVVADVDVPGDGRRWWLQDCDGFTPTKRADARAYVHIDGRVMRTGSAIRLDGLDLREAGTPAGRGRRMRAIPFNDTPNPRTGEPGKSGIMIEVPAEGWPDRWNESLSGDYRTTMIGRIICTVPNTELGRRAAWAMEGE